MRLSIVGGVGLVGLHVHGVVGGLGLVGLHVHDVVLFVVGSGNLGLEVVVSTGILGLFPLPGAFNIFLY